MLLISNAGDKPLPVGRCRGNGAAGARLKTCAGIAADPAIATLAETNLAGFAAETGYSRAMKRS